MADESKNVKIISSIRCLGERTRSDGRARDEREWQITTTYTAAPLEYALVWVPRPFSHGGV
jgi:hypothetical protein